MCAQVAKSCNRSHRQLLCFTEVTIIVTLRLSHIWLVELLLEIYFLKYQDLKDIYFKYFIQPVVQSFASPGKGELHYMYLSIGVYR